MKSIKFSESELEFLQNHYELELLDAENYVGEIKNILNKLGKIEKEIIKEKPVKTSGKKRGRPAKKQKVPTEVVTSVLAKPVNAAKSSKAVSPKIAVKATKKKVKVSKSSKTAVAGIKVDKAPVEEPKME